MWYCCLICSSNIWRCLSVGFVDAMLRRLAPGKKGKGGMRRDETWQGAAVNMPSEASGRVEPPTRRRVVRLCGYVYPGARAFASHGFRCRSRSGLQARSWGRGALSEGRGWAVSQDRSSSQTPSPQPSPACGRGGQIQMHRSCEKISAHLLIDPARK